MLIVCKSILLWALHFAVLLCAWGGYSSRSSVEGHHQLYKSGQKLQVKEVSGPLGLYSVQWGQRLNVAANFCQPPWRRAHLSLDFQLCCPVCSEFLLPAKACGTMVRDPLCMLGLSRLVRCSLQPILSDKLRTSPTGTPGAAPVPSRCNPSS